MKNKIFVVKSFKELKEICPKAQDKKTLILFATSGNRKDKSVDTDTFYFAELDVKDNTPITDKLTELTTKIGFDGKVI